MHGVIDEGVVCAGGPAQLAECLIVDGQVAVDCVRGRVEELDGGAVPAVVVGKRVAPRNRIVADQVVVTVEEDAEGPRIVIAVWRAWRQHTHLVVIENRVVLDRVVTGASGNVDACHVAS